MNGRNLATLKTISGDKTTLGVSVAGCPASYPLRPFYVQLPSGMKHWFESEMQARQSQYWGEIAHKPQQPALTGM